MKIFGILNITEDSFSDGGLFLRQEKALPHITKLIKDGADVIDIGAQSSNPNSKIVEEKKEWERIFLALKFIQGYFPNTLISVDTYKPKIISKCLEQKVHYINNIRGYDLDETKEVLQNFKDTNTHFITMFSHNRGEKAVIKSNLTVETVISKIDRFFEEQIELFEKIGISIEKLIFDTGLGFFLSPDFEVSLEVLRNIDFFIHKYKKIMISVGKKSFIENLCKTSEMEEREIPSLLIENFLLQKGVLNIRTHNPKFLSQAKLVNKALSK